MLVAVSHPLHNIQWYSNMYMYSHNATHRSWRCCVYDGRRPAFCYRIYLTVCVHTFRRHKSKSTGRGVPWVWVASWEAAPECAPSTGLSHHPLDDLQLTAMSASESHNKYSTTYRFCLIRLVRITNMWPQKLTFITEPSNRWHLCLRDDKLQQIFTVAALPSSFKAPWRACM